MASQQRRAIPPPRAYLNVFLFASARKGFFWRELDPSCWAIRLMGWLGVAWGIRPVPRRVYAEDERSLAEPRWGVAS